MSALTEHSRFFALIPCAGTGSRAVAGTTAALGGQSLPKQYQHVAGQPMVMHTLAAFAAVARIAQTLVVVAPGDTFFKAAEFSFTVADCGGPTRAKSVSNGLLRLLAQGAGPADWVLVHDAARCLITPEQIDALMDACQHDAVGGLLAHKLPDTLKSEAAGLDRGRVAATIDRSGKWLAQTPQMFRIGMLMEALQKAGDQATDESSAIETMGLHPRLVPGGAQNFKVTYPEDFQLAQAVLMTRQHGGTLERFGGERGEVAHVPPRTIF
ncbi:MAG TPA: 2-C-methyl-D-erythritol 4-phosphate cytidylyltransferase [Burkholderiaceae bacterium]|nr:2-C-methyl-D-erythritol 4-phosphate cytidylyltransferase [Burkholderiaceae bacterium]